MNNLNITALLNGVEYMIIIERIKFKKRMFIDI